MKNSLKLLFVAVAALSLSCGGIKKTENGSEYTLLKDSSSTNIKVGDWIIFNYSIVNSKDSVLKSSYTSGMPGAFKVDTNYFKGQMNEALTMASQGDSIAIFEPVDSIIKNMPPQAKAQPGIIPGTKIKYLIKILHVFEKKDSANFMTAYQKYNQLAMEKQRKTYEEEQKKAAEEAKVAEKEEPAKIEAYLKKSGEKFTKTAEGYYILKTKTTNGAQAKSGDTVVVHYTGTLLDGKQFDSSIGNEPFSFLLGGQRVIKGWDLGIAQLKVGEKAKYLFPSSLAYGPMAPSAEIKAFSPLLFEVELLEIKK